MANNAMMRVPQTAPWGSLRTTVVSKYHEIAERFIREFPIGSLLTVDEFGVWAMRNGLLTIPATRDKRSDAWVAFIQRRNDLRKNINRAGTHVHMLDRGEDVTSFFVRSVGGGLLEVQAPVDAASRAPLGQRVNSLVGFYEHEMCRQFQSTDWQNATPEMLAEAKAMTTAVRNFREQIQLTSRQMSERMADFHGVLENSRVAIASNGKPAAALPPGELFDDVAIAEAAD